MRGSAGQGGSNTAGGTGALVVGGNGTVVLDPLTKGGGGAANTFTGGIRINSGMLELGKSLAAGKFGVYGGGEIYGAITFADGGRPT